jgi:hypothetical protein
MPDGIILAHKLPVVNTLWQNYFGQSSDGTKV